MTVKINRDAQTSQAGGASEGDSPAKQFARQGNEPVDVTDSRGRVIRLKRPNPIAKLNFFEAMGSGSESRIWAGTVMPMMFVVSIDGVAVSTPVAKSEILALYARLDEDGMEAVQSGIAEHFGASRPEVDMAEAKK